MQDRTMQVERVLSLAILVSAAVFSSAGTVDLDTIPESIASRIEKLGDKYEFSDRINPYYLRGDFDADGRVDYAVLINERGTKKRGFVVVLSSLPKVQVLGAGIPVQYGATKWDDLNFDSWRVYGRTPVDAGTGFDPPPGRGDLILVQKRESASGFFRWSGSRFSWVQQGD